MECSRLIAVAAAGAVAHGAAASVIRDDGADAAARALGGQPVFASSARVDVAGGVGSGTLVASGWVLTAAHVVTDSSGAPLPLGSLSVTVNGESRGVAEIVVRPGWTGANYTAGVDLALVRLSAPVESVAPAQRWSGGVENREVTLTGFGAFGFGSFGLTEPAGSLRGATNVYDSVASVLYPAWSPSLALMDFDSPLTDTYNRSGLATATNLEGSPAMGDSGGGSFVLEDGVWRLAGVHSFTFTLPPAGAAAPFGYGTGAADVLVGSASAWIDSVIPTPGAAALLAGAAAFSAHRRRK